MTKQTVLNQRDAAILCFLSALAGWLVVSGAANSASMFVWNCLTTSIMWFIT